MDPPWSRQKIQEAFSGVKELRVDLWSAEFGEMGDGEVLGRFEGVMGVGKASVERGYGGTEGVKGLERRMMRRVGEDEEGRDVDGKG